MTETEKNEIDVDNSKKYCPKLIEPKWQHFWVTNKTFRAEIDRTRPKYYILDMFPYPSGAGLHVGHPEGYTATDIVARYKRMKGFSVLHPMGWDAFGLPAEQHALQTGTHPAITTKSNITTFKRQIQALGFSYDWDREVSTCEPDYYRWTQWIFAKLYEQGLAYMADIPVNWCPELGTVLANEEVIDGKSERGSYDVIRRPMRQWVLKITAYAEKLLEGLEALDWPESIKEMQRNWIGRSEGSSIFFQISDHADLVFEVYTTRPDTLFGATYCVLAPEHPLIESIVTPKQKEVVESYVREAKQKSDRLRLEEATKKTGVFTGAYAINPANRAQIPIYVADYVLITYGTGAIMAVPGHDQRDWDFAKKYSLPIIEVVSGGDIKDQAWEGEGVLVNSGFLNGLTVSEAKKEMTAWLEEKGIGERKVNYKLRDWIFSRQRYWGEPFPIIHTDNGPKLVNIGDLPVILPEVEQYQPTPDGEPPLARARNWLKTTDPDTGESALRETNTMPQWAGSCWYYLRFLDAKNDKEPWGQIAENYWMPVDLYVGGVEHAVLHLLYARFWHRVLYDLKLVSTPEPFKKLVNQGMILGEDHQKMSKARGNVINPDEVISKYGADTLRCYEMFMGPLEQVKPWNTQSIGGVYRFLNRVWNLIINENGMIHSRIIKQSEAETQDQELQGILHRTIKKVTDDIEQMKFHTAIAALMSLSNEFYERPTVPQKTIEQFILLLSPFAPHLAEELWERLGRTQSLAYEPWPQFDQALIKSEVMTIAVQVNGKLRDTINISTSASKEEIIEAAKRADKVKAYLDGNQINREVYAPKRLVNFVIG